MGGYYFNSAQLIARKTKLARALGLAGVMIWEVGPANPNPNPNPNHSHSHNPNPNPNPNPDQVGQDCRLSPVTHGDKTHVRTCPGEGDGSSLLVAVHRAVADFAPLIRLAGDVRQYDSSDLPDGGGGEAAAGEGVYPDAAHVPGHDEL